MSTVFCPSSRSAGSRRASANTLMELLRSCFIHLGDEGLFKTTNPKRCYLQGIQGSRGRFITPGSLLMELNASK